MKKHIQITELVREAIDQIKSGRIEDGLLTLERAIDPKYDSFDHAYGAYCAHKDSRGAVAA